ncbi:hypothetical protein [Rubritalea tangerina]
MRLRQNTYRDDNALKVSNYEIPPFAVWRVTQSPSPARRLPPLPPLQQKI